MKSLLHFKLKTIILCLTIVSTSSVSLFAQTETDTLSDWDRTFMPAIQMGYATHLTDELSGGLMVQTSIEYRDISNFIFRINYDDFNTNIDVEYPINTDVSFTGNASFSELIIGVGYRQQLQKHNITAYVQPGFRFYGYPEFNTDSIQVNLDFDSRNVGIIRYSLGYEYAIAPKLFLTIEGFVSHALKSIDFWADNRWSYGATIGVSAPLF